MAGRVRILALVALLAAAGAIAALALGPAGGWQRIVAFAGWTAVAALGVRDLLAARGEDAESERPPLEATQPIPRSKTPLGLVAPASPVACGKCGKPFPPGAPICPFCHAVPQESAFEKTVAKGHQPLRGPVAMPGLAAVEELKERAGARGYLHIIEGPNKGESILLGKRVVTIGRAPGNIVMIQDAGMSNQHAEIRPQGSDYVIVDAGSKNGTFVNDVRVTEKKLATGDVVSIGSTKAFVHIS